jgi:hypothetical protein
VSNKGRLKIFEVEESEFVAGFSKHSDIKLKKIFVYNPVMTGTGAYLKLIIYTLQRNFETVIQL